jgi:hypothetical protein
MKKDLTGPEILEILANTGSKDWNESLSSRLESVRGYLSQDEWTKGLSPYLRATMGHAMLKMLGESLPHDANNYLRGFIAALKMVVSLPQSVESQIKQEVDKTNSGPKGSAGY